jgi:hypothetical protein
MLTSGELAQERQAEQATMTETATIGRKTRAASGTGGMTSTTATQNVPCKREASLTGDGQQMEGGRLFTGLRWIITLPALTDVQKDDVITIGGQVYDITGIQGPYTDEISRIVLAEAR